MLDFRHASAILLILITSIYIGLALIERFTRIRIQRVGYLSLRHVDIPLPAGLALHIGSVGVELHRPTITVPTWITLKVSNAQLTVDLDVLQRPDNKLRSSAKSQPRHAKLTMLQKFGRAAKQVKKYTRYNLIQWIDAALVDLSVEIKDCGSIQLGLIHLRVAHKLSRAKRHLHVQKPIERDVTALLYLSKEIDAQGLEFFLVLGNLRCQLAGEAPFEVVDSLLMNIWTEFGGDYTFRNSGVSCKFGKMQLVVDELISFYHRVLPQASIRDHSENSLDGAKAESEKTVDQDLHNLFDLLTEVQISIGFLRTSYQARDVFPAGKPAIITAASKDVIMDLNRLRDGSPEHRMLFGKGIIAHQALISLISLSVNIHASDRDETLLNIPMSTFALKTSTPAFLLLSKQNSAVPDTSPYPNIITLHSVVTSPSSNIHALQIPILMALFRPSSKRKSQPAKQPVQLSSLVAKLPRVDLTLGVHDPSFRVILEAHDDDASPAMIIGRLSSIYIDTLAQIKDNDDFAVDIHALTNTGRLYYHSPTNEESDVLVSDKLSLKITSSIHPVVKASIDCVVDEFRAEISRPEVVDCFSKIMEVLHTPTILPAKLASPQKHKAKTHPLSKIPTWLEAFKLQARKCSALVSGADEEVAPDLRGLKIALDNFLIDYGKSSVIMLDSEDRKNGNGFYRGHVSESLQRDALQSNKRHLYRKVLATLQSFRVYTVDSGSVLDERHPLLVLPVAEVSASQSTDSSGDLLHLGFRVDDLVLGFSLYKVYATLQVLQVLRASFFRRKRTIGPKDDPAEHVAHQATDGGIDEQDDVQTTSRGPLQYTIEGKINLIRIKTRLPLDENQMIDLDHIHFFKHLTGEPQVKLRYARLYVDSPAYPGAWDRIVSIRDIQVSRETHVDRTKPDIQASKTLVLRTDGLKIRVPHQYVFYKTLEAMINSLKTTTQIIHRFITQTNDYVIAQHPKQPKTLPRVRIKSRILVVEAEDDPFEARLGLIFRVALSEQRMREARELAFDRKVMKLRENQASRKSKPSAPSKSDSRSYTGSIRSNLTGHQDQSDSQSFSDHNLEPHNQDYDTEFSEQRDKLMQHNSRAWISRMKHALLYRLQKVHDLRQTHWGKDVVSRTGDQAEQILEVADRPPLFAMLFLGVDLVLNKPSFPLTHLPDYIHRVGRGMPKDTQYGLLIPVNLTWKMDEARINLRDYPLPLLHIPPLHDTQREKLSAWSFTTDLVIAEEFPEPEAIRHIDVCVIPADTGRTGSPAFNVEVQRTATSVKTYAEISINLNSAMPTRVHWGSSMQPAVSDVMRILDTLSKPQQDPSPKLGFWDKLGLVMHMSMKFSWKEDGDLHITLKGSRDPYVVLGAGAGLTKVFRGNVQWHINVSPDSRKLMEVTCDEYMLAISDFGRRTTSAFAPRQKETPQSPKNKDMLHHYHLSRKELDFQKIIMKLTGDVRWTAGLAFERHCEEDECTECDGKNECRLWTFKPHWDVKLRIPEYAILPGGKIRDAFKEYRSHYIHGQISVTSRCTQDAAEGYNSMHLTPRVFAHFFDWLHSFSGNLSLPIRAGPLFPSTEGPKQKFGQHLMTLKYNLQIEPLYLSHVYRSSSAQSLSHTESIGVKARVDSFTMDLHQRKEERVVTNKVLETQRTSQHMSIYRGQVDLKVTDLRALTASFEADENEDDLHPKTSKDPMNPDQNPRGEQAVRLGEFDVQDDEVKWIDMDDFSELDTILPIKSPRCRIIPLAYAPRFTYDRDTTFHEGKGPYSGKDVEVLGQRFGFEETHLCSMHKDDFGGSDGHLGEVQGELWRQRRQILVSEVEKNAERQRDLEASAGKKTLGIDYNEQRAALADHDVKLRKKIEFLDDLTSKSGSFLKTELEASRQFDSEHHGLDYVDAAEFLQHLREETETFNNRFVVHDPQLKWNNTLRNILIRYIQQVNQRRGFSYYMSQKAIRFLTDLVSLQQKSKASDSSGSESASDSDTPSSTQQSSKDDSSISEEVETLIKQLMDDREHHFYVADETKQESNTSEGEPAAPTKAEDKTKSLHKDYEAVNNYILRLVAPQIQLQSEKNEDSVIVLSTQSMQMKILAIKDKTIASDDVSALVQRNFKVQMTGAQFFSARLKDYTSILANPLISNSYGAKKGSFWPPWVPMEAVYDFEGTPLAFERIVDRTSVLCTYIKNNQLRIKGANHATSTSDLNVSDTEDRVDSITVHFPKFNLAADPVQYYAMFTIAIDLLMYSEPLQKQRNEQLEKILLSADFSDLSGAPEMVSSLQKRIRQLSDFKSQFKLHAQANDPQCKDDEARVSKELELCEDELFFLMKSIATAQQKHEDRDSELMPAMRWHLKADEILWHLMDGKTTFIDFGLSKASFQRTDNSDSSNFNTLEIEMMQGINLSPDPVFAELLAPYFGHDRTVVDARRSKMVRIYWYMLEAIGGIAVCDHFEVNLFPLRLQMEHDVSKRLFAYVFPDRQKSVENGSDSEEDDDDAADSNSSSSSDEDDESEDKRHQAPAPESHRNHKISFERLKHPSSLLHPHSSGRSASNSLHKDSNSIRSQGSENSGTEHSLTRVTSSNSLQRTKTVGAAGMKKKKDINGSSDDLAAMMSRASKNMSLVYVKVPSVILALSYKGAKAKNFVDVTDFVFKMPTIEYRNKTWSYLDLAEHLKREVIKAVLAHTGSLLKDKMTHYRKSKSHQSAVSKQIASYRASLSSDSAEAKFGRPSVDCKPEYNGASSAFALQTRSDTAETSSLYEEEHTGHGLFNNSIGRHIQHLSHIARHKDGLAEDNAESTVKKTRMLLGKFIDKAK